jgi:hypothetical protein
VAGASVSAGHALSANERVLGLRGADSAVREELRPRSGPNGGGQRPLARKAALDCTEAQGLARPGDSRCSPLRDGCSLTESKWLRAFA